MDRRTNWVEIQQNTFTNWINEELYEASRRSQGTTPKYEVKDIQTGFQDGLALLALLKKLHTTRSINSTKSEEDADSTVQALIPAHENPKKVFEMCENLEKCLNFMKEQKFSGIESTGPLDIYDGKLNLILGLVYSLIYRYHIQRKVQENTSQVSTTSSKFVNDRAIIALLSWINWQIHKRFPSMKKIRNLNRDWNDGIALCALIESIKPGTFPKCTELSKSDKENNCKKGLDLGSKCFAIPKLISAEHLSDPGIDETSVMIYLCYYLQYCFKLSDDSHQDSHQNEPYIEQVPRYIIKFLDDVGLVAIPPTKEDLLANVKTPSVPDSTKCVADLDFFEQSVFAVGQTIVFTVDCVYAGDKGKLEITGKTMDTNEQIKTEFRKRSDRVFNCFVRAETVGTHELNIQWGEKGNYEHIKNSPLRFTVCNPKAVAFDNTQNRYNVYVGDTIEFGVDISKAGSADMLYAEFSDQKMSYEIIRSNGKVTFVYVADKTHKGPSELTIYFNGIKIKVFEITVASDYLKANPKMETQVTVFTNYINYILQASSSSNKEVSSLQWDFQSGVALAVLLKFLSGNDIGNLNSEPENRLQMTQNLKACFTFMESLRLELHDINEEDIYNGDGEAILKVLWEIIKFYHICKCSTGGTIEETMLIWVQAVLSTTAVNNFVTDWYDGILLCRLLEMLEPGLCPQYSVLQASGARGNCEFAIKHAKKHFGIPAVISTEMLQKGNLDEKCILIYLAFFIQNANKLLFTWVQTILRDRNIKNLTTDWCDGENFIALCNTLCFRVLPTWHALDSHSAKQNFATAKKTFEENLGIKCSQNFSSEVFSATQMDELIISAYLYNFRYALEKIDARKCQPFFENQQRVNIGDPIKFYLEYSGTNTGEITLYGQDPRYAEIFLNDPIKDQQTYHVESHPTNFIGDHKIAVYWNKTAIPGSPFTIYVGNPKSVIVESLPEQVTIGEEMVFELDARQAGNGIVAVKAIGPGSAKEDIIFSKICEHEIIKGKYKPPVVGTIEIVFTFNRVIVNQQQCMVSRKPSESKNCRIHHDYLNRDHLLDNSQELIKFSVDATNAIVGSLSATVTVNNKRSHNVQAIRPLHVDKSKGVKYHFSFSPQKPLIHTVAVKWNDHDIPGSPFRVHVIDPAKCKPNKNDLPLKPQIFGKCGKAILNDVIKFKIDTNGAGDGTLQSIISQPGHKSITLTPISISKSGEYTFEYKPCEVGRFDIIIRYSKTEINRFKCYTVPNISSGPGIIALPSSFAYLGEPFEFYMQDNKSYRAIVYDPQNNKVKIDHDKINTFLASFTPQLTGSYVMFEENYGQCIPNSSSIIQCFDPRKCKMLKRIPKVIQVGEAIEFKVTSAGAGLGVLSVLINGKEDCQMCTAIVNTQQDDRLHSVTLMPKLVGEMLIQILFADRPISEKIAKVQLCDANNCEVVMKTETCLVGNPFIFTLYTANAGFGKAIVKVRNPSDQHDKVDITKTKDGSFQCVFTPVEIGQYSIDVIWGIAHVPGSPFTLTVEKPTGALCLAIGSGLNKAIVGRPAKFYITAESGLLNNGGLFLSIRAVDHEYKAKVGKKETSAGHYDVEYTAPTTGEYVAEIKCHGREIIFSPFKIDVIQGADASKCTVSEIKPKYTNTPIKFDINTSQGGDGILSIVVRDPNERKIDVLIKQKKNGKQRVRFVADNEGTHTVSVLWSDVPVPGTYSPLEIQAHQFKAASKVHAYGEGLSNGKVGEIAEFIIQTKDAGQEDLLIDGLSAEGLCEVRKEQKQPGIYKASYNPSVVGDTFINIKYGRNKDHIPGSPFKVCITSSDASPGLQVQGLLPLKDNIVFLNTGVTYTVSTRGVMQGKIKSIVARPGQRSIILTPVNDEGTRFEYRPCEKGRFFIILRNLHYSIDSVGGSPFACIAVDNSNIKSTETGVISMPDRIALLNKLYTFYIQGSPTYTAVVYDPKNKEVPLSRKPQSHVAEFVPTYTGSYVVLEVNKGQLIPNSSSVLQCIDPSKCKVLGDLPTYLQVGKTKEFIVTSADAGLGALSVSINGKEDNQMCSAVVNTHQDSRCHKVTLKPRFAGEVSIKLLFVGLTIPQFETPFKVQICDASKCKLVMSTDPCLVGNPFTFTLNTAGAGLGKAIVEVYDPYDQQDKDTINIVNNIDGAFQCTYTPVEIGEHSVNVIWGIDLVPGSPFKIVADKPAGVMCLAIGSGLSRAVVGKPAKFYVTAKKSGLLNDGGLFVCIKAVDHECKAEVDICEASSGHYDVKYTAQTVGEYVAEIKYYDKEIMFSPFRIDVLQGADASKCKIIEPQGHIYAKDLLEFNVDTSKGGDGILKVVATDLNDKALDVFITKLEDGQHHVAFIPENEGVHTVSVLWSEVHVPRSPLKLNINQFVAAQKVYAYGQGLCNGTVGELAIFSVVTKDAGHGVPTINGFSTEGTFVIDLKEKEAGTYEAKYMPPNVEDISIYIKWFDISIPGSPFTVHITQHDLTHNPQPDVPSDDTIQHDCQVKGLPRNNIVYINTDVPYTVSTKGVRHGTVESVISFSNRISHTLLPIKQKNGEYHFRFMPMQEGKFEISVRSCNKDLLENPCKCVAIDKDSAGVIFIPDKLAQVGLVYEFYVHGSQSYSTVVYDPLNKEVELLKPTDSMMCFTPRLTGYYAIFEEIHGQQISNNSYILHCIDPNKCEILGGLPEFLQVGKAARFIVTSRDAGPGILSVQFGDEGDHQICQKRVNYIHSLHLVTLKPILVGRISIKVTYSDILIKTPSKVEICDAYQCKLLSGLNGQHTVGKEITFRLGTAGAGCGKAIVKIQSPTNHHEQRTVNITETMKNVLECTFTPIEIGEHSAVVMWGIEQILGSPFKFTVVKSNEVVVIAGLENLIHATARVPTKFSIQANEGGLMDSGALTVSIGSIHYKAQVNSEDVGDGVYNITYTAPEGGGYIAEIKYLDEQITGSHFKIKVNEGHVTDSAKEDASKCQVTAKIQSEDVHYTNTSVECDVDTSQASSRMPDITIRDPDDQQVDMFVENYEGRYTVKFIPEIEGIYTTTVLISGHHVQGSPLKLHCVTTNAKMVKASGKGLSHGKVKEWEEFSVDTRDAGQGPLTITAVSKKGPFDVEYKPEHERSSRYKARYNPPTAGEILITIKWSDVEIPNSPFKVAISNYNEYEPLAAARKPSTLIATNPTFIPGPGIDEDNFPEESSSYTDSEVVESESELDSGDDATSTTGLVYSSAPHPTQKKSDTVVMIVDERTVHKTTVIQRPKEDVNHYLHLIISFIFPPWLIIWIILCCIHGC